MHRLLSDRARGWRRALYGVALGLLAWSAHGVPAKAPQDLRIDGEVLPGRSIDLLEQALSRVKFNTDPQRLRRGLVENRLLARAVEDQLTAQSRADLDASVEIEAGNLLEQVYGRRYREDLGLYLRQPRALDAERLREVLAPRRRGLVENSLLLDETQRREAAGVELIGWQFPGQPAQVLDLLSLYEGDNVQGQVELQQGNLAYLARQVQTRIRRDYLWYRLARDGFGPAERQGVRTLVRDKLVRHRYLHQIGLYSDFHHESDALRELAGKVSDKDAEAYYRRNLERYRNVAQVHCAYPPGRPGERGQGLRRVAQRPGLRRGGTPLFPGRRQGPRPARRPRPDPAPGRSARPAAQDCADPEGRYGFPAYAHRRRVRDRPGT
ncbi:hypothetical protein O0441_00290 [Pseudomonas aeruginosa]|nr:hypothetical protein [Pseudomonas aeruginosa]